MAEVKRIRNDAELDEALARIGELLQSEPGSPQYDELNVLSDLVQAYEDKQLCYWLAQRHRGHRVLHGAYRGLTLDDLAELIGGKQEASEVLSGKRDITMPMARALYKHWGISSEVLLQEPDV